MGSNLRRQLREALPPSIKGLQRAVALEIADDARYDDGWNYSPEKGRRSRVRLAELVQWTAAKDELSVREMLRRLSLAGWEFRLPIGKDKNGNLLYAVPGKAMTFRVPDFEGPTTVGPCVDVESEGPTTVGPEDAEGPTVSAQGPTVVEVGPTVVGAGPTVVGAGPTTVGPPSPVSSFSTKESPSSSPVAEDSATTVSTAVAAEEGGGGGDSDSEEQEDDTPQRAETFVDSLSYRGRQPRKQQRQKLAQLVVAAFKGGWTENGLRRYLDISDDPNVRFPAAVYEHRLAEDELPDGAMGQSTLLPPIGPGCHHDPAAATDPALRTSPFGGLCPDCHPDLVGKAAPTPPVCDACLQNNPAARTNMRFRFQVDHNGDMAACHDCHPAAVARQPARERDTADGGMWNRAMSRAQQRMQPHTGARAAAHTADDYAASGVDDLFAPRQPLIGTDAKVAGWMALSRQLAADEPKPGVPQPTITPPRHQPYRDPEDQSVYDEPFPGPTYTQENR